jgi:hypothetical protein
MHTDPTLIDVIANATTIDSGALAGLSAVVHKFSQPGSYQSTVLLNDQQVLTGVLEVQLASDAAPSAGATATAAGPVEAAQPRVDLAQAAAAGAAQLTVPAAAEGYVLFHALGADGGHAVIAQAQPSQPSAGASAELPELFDSRQLGPGDIFSTIMLRPGTYSMTNTVDGAQGDISVSYPVISSTRYTPPEPATVACDAGAFSPSSLALSPAQGIIFTINTTARIVVNLVTPDDGPGASSA